MTGHLSRSVNDFFDTVPISRPQIESVTLLSLDKMFNSQDVGTGDVGNMDVITDTGTIGSPVVVTKDKDLFAFAEGDLAK
jgi:hypothetical protein